MDSNAFTLDKLRATIPSFQDFPKKGVVFRDIHPVMNDPEAREFVLQNLIERYKDKNLNAIVGLESRGYYFGIPLAWALKLPFVPIRKAGKLPGEVVQYEYKLEYGSDKVELQKASIKKGDRVLVVDDLLATGGTAKAACELLHACGAEIVACEFLIELEELGGRKKAPEGVTYHAMLKY